MNSTRGHVDLVVRDGIIILSSCIDRHAFQHRLGTVGVFYGDRLGHDVAWCERFPFSFCAHPQYVGVVLTIWGFFFGMRFPHDDWFVLPALETLYYAVGARLEDGWPLSRATGPAPLGGRLT